MPLARCPWLIGLVLRIREQARTLPRGAAHGRGGAVAGRGDRPAARGAGPAGPRRPRRGRALARGDPGPGRVGAVPQGRRHPGAQEDDGEHRDLGALVAAGRPPGADHRRTERAAQRADRRPRQPDRRGACRAATRWCPARSARRSRCRPSSTSSPSACSRRCSPTRSSTAGATSRSSVERHWEGELRIEVRNVDRGTRRPRAIDRHGQGLDGMRRRLESVGGRLDVRRREEAGGATFTATAWVPLDGRA